VRGVAIGNPISTEPQFTIAVAEGGTFAMLNPGVLGVTGCPICAGPIRRSRFGRPSMACYISNAKRGEIRCLKPERLAGEAGR
jgi:hypothetical protein